MNIALLGATGKTGKEVLARLINDQNNNVRALVRNPAGFAEQNNGLAGKCTVLKGDVMDEASLIEAFNTCEVVISALGTGLENVNTEIYSKGGLNILNAMRKAGSRKLITITSASVDLTDTAIDTFFMNRIIRPNYNKVYYDMTKWETILDMTRDIQWVCTRPTKLNDKPYTGNYRVNLNHCPKGGWRISRADLADFMVKQVEDDGYLFEKPVIAY